MLLGIGQMWGDNKWIIYGDLTIGTNNWYEVANVGRITNKSATKGAAFGSANYATSGVCDMLGGGTGSATFSLQTYIDISGVILHTAATSDRTLNYVNVADALTAASASANVSCTIDGSITRNKCDNLITVTFTSTISANKYINFLFAGNADIQAIELIPAGSVTPDCTKPTIAWNVEPQGGEVGAADVTASVKDLAPSGATVTWVSSKPEVATVTNGVVHFVAAGKTTISASIKGDGETYCDETVKVEKEITVTKPSSLVAHQPGKYESSTGYNTALTKYDNRDYETYFISWSSSKLYLAAGMSWVTAASGSKPYCLIDGTTATEQSIGDWGTINSTSYSGSNTSPQGEFAISNSANSTHYASLTSSTSLTIKVKGYDQFSFGGRDNGTSDGKKFVVTIDGVAQTFTHTSTDWTIYRFDITTGEHTIVVTGDGSNANRLRAFSLRLPAGYSVTYDANGGSGTTTDSNKYKKGAEVTLQNNGFTAPTGKKFDKWSVDNSIGEKAEGEKFTMPDANVKVTAQWKWIDYTITCTGDDYGTVSATGTPNYGQSITLNIAPKSDGYELNSLTVKEDESDKSIEVSDDYKFTMPASDVTVTATFREKLQEFDISFANGGHGTAPSAITASNVTLAAITGVTGYTCTGWTADVDVKVGDETVFAGTPIDNGTNVIVLQNTQFTAQWETNKHKVTFDVAGGSEIDEMTNIEYNSDVNLSEKTPTKDGYRFDGWTSTDVTINNNAFKMPDKDVTVTATWQPETYEITYDLGDGSWDGTAGKGTYTYGTEYTLPTNVTKQGYIFVKWQKNGSDISKITATTFGNVAVKAIWNEIKYAKSLDFEVQASTGGSISDFLATGNMEISSTSGKWDSSDAAYKGWKINISDVKITFWVQAGSSLSIELGEKTDAKVSLNGGEESTLSKSSVKDCGTMSVDTKVVIRTTNTTTTSIQKITIEAPAVKHSVTYAHSEGSTGNLPTQADVAEDKTFTVASAEDLTPPSGKEFKCWNDGTADYAAGDSYTMGTSNVTLTATWKAIATKYDVTFDANGGKGEMPAQKYAAGDEVTLPACIFEAPNDDKEFDQWISEDVEITDSKFTMIAQSVVVKATWKDVDPTAEIVLYNYAAQYRETATGKYLAFNDDDVTASGTGKNKTFVRRGCTLDVAAGAYDKKDNLINAFIKYVDKTTSAKIILPSCKKGTVVVKYGSYGTGRVLTVNGAKQTAPKAAISDGSITADNLYTTYFTTVTLENQQGEVVLGADGGNIYISYVSVTLSADPVTYTVAYNANGAASGTAPSDPNEYACQNEVTVLGNTGSLAKDGYAFGGWNTQADGMGTNYNAGATFQISAPTTLYAKWNEIGSSSWGYLGTGTAGQNTYATKAMFPGTDATSTVNDVELTSDPGWDTYYQKLATDVENTTANKLQYICLHTNGLAANLKAINTKVLVSVSVAYTKLGNDANLYLQFANESGNLGNEIAVTGNTQSELQKVETFAAPAGATKAKLFRKTGTADQWNTGISYIKVIAAPEHAIAKTTAEHGSFAVKVGGVETAKAAEGAVVVLAATPDELYELEEWNVYKTGEEATKVTIDGNQFIMPEYDVTVAASFTKSCETPTITTQPASHDYLDTDVIQPLKVVAEVTDGGELSYQWYKDDEVIEEAIEASYTPTEAGSYKVVVTNTLGTKTASATSNVAVITITHIYTFASWDGSSSTFTKEGEWTIYPYDNSNRWVISDQKFKENQAISSTDATAKANVFTDQYFLVVFEKDMKAIQVLDYYTGGDRTVSDIYTVETLGNASTSTKGSSAVSVKDKYGFDNKGRDAAKVSTSNITGHFEAGVNYVFKMSSSSGNAIFDFITTPAEIEEESAGLTAGKIDGIAMTDAQLAELNGESHTLTLTKSAIFAPNVEFTYKHTQTYDDGVEKIIEATEKGVSAKVSGNYEVSKEFEGTTYKVVCPINTTPAIKLSVETLDVSFALSAAISKSAEVTLTGYNLENGEYSVNIPTIEGLSITPTVFTVADGQVNETFTVTFAAEDRVTVATTDIVFSDGITSKTLPVTYGAMLKYTLQDVSENITWDFSKVPANPAASTGGITATEDNQVMANIAGVANNADFNSQTLMMMVAGEYAYRSSSYKCFQGSAIKFHAAVPGSLEVTYCGPGDSKQANLFVNGKACGSVKGSATSSGKIYVEAGDVEITFTGDDNKARLYSMTFTAAEAIRDGLTKDKVGTMCLTKGVVAKFGAAVYEIDDRNPIGINLIEAELPLVAGRPYIFIAEASEFRVLYDDNVYNGEETMVTYRGLVGNVNKSPRYDIEKWSEKAHNYIFQNNHICPVKTQDCWVVPGRAYVDMLAVEQLEPQSVQSDAAPRRRITLSSTETNTPTILENVTTDKQVKKVIINNKLVIFRQGHTFNAQGALLK